jgi:KaiC/GvpD/RAD55 family RecA-like ATPase
MWGDQKGFAYIPLKEVTTSDNGGHEKWETSFFNWPVDRDQAIQHVLQNTANVEVYFSPALYKEPGKPDTANILGSHVLWTEFDGNAPKGGILGDKIPHPTMRVRSSNEGHEHFYWRLDHFETDRTKFEDINRAIAYTLQADSSAWDSTQILRPPATKNHKRNKVVRILTTSASSYGLDFFSGLEIPKQLSKTEADLGDIPDAISVIAKYKWDTEEFLFFRKAEMATGTRSSALMRLAYNVAEMRMTDEEAYSILRNADDRWGKFKGRSDQTKRLLDLVNRARLKYPLDPEATVDGLQVFGWQDLKKLEIHIDWLIPGILQRQGIMVVSGKPGVGKTQFTMQALIHIALGKPMLGWKIDAPRKVAFLSMEMGSAEIKIFQDEMDSILSEEEKNLLQQNFLIVPIGQSLLFDQSADRKKIEQFLETYRPEVAAFDSLSKTTLNSLDEVSTKAVMDFADNIRMNHDCSVIFIHHDRKAQIGNRRPKSLEDVYGSFYITATATTVIGMWYNEKSYEIEINYLKVRLAQAPATQCVMRTERGLMFEEIGMLDMTSAIVQHKIEGENGTETSNKQDPPLTGFQAKL